MPRADKGVKRAKYNGSYDDTGKLGKENILLKAFWKLNKVSDFMTLSQKEADKKIDEWMEGYQERNLKKDKGWWYPSVGGLNLNEIRNKRTDIDKGWHL